MIGGWVHWTCIRGNINNIKHGWKIGWHNLPARTSRLEGICWWCGKLKGLWSGASFGLAREAHQWEIIKSGILDHKQWGWVWGFAVLEGMSMVQKMGGKAIKMFSNSRLVVGQVGGELEAKDERMRGYLTQVRFLQSKFESFILHHIPRSGNTHTDSLSTLASSST